MPECSIQFDIAGRRVSRTAGCREPFYRRDFRGIADVMLPVVFAFLAANISVAKDSAARLELMTTAFYVGGTIPTQFTCSGENRSPFLSWTQPPPGTQSFVLIVDDPDAPGGTWVHWVVYDLPAAARQLPEHIPAGEVIAGGGKQGINDFPINGYGGPCPPRGKRHRYFFRLYALDKTLALNAPAHRTDVDSAMKGHVLAQAELVGTFGR